jgi:molybdopterin synthase catalytic subunit
VTVEITSRRLQLASVERRLVDPLSGAVVLFVGRVRRDGSRGRFITALDYETDRTLVLRQLRQLDRKAVRRYGARRVYIIHRVGRIPVGAASVLIGVAAAHRAMAFRAARFLIEELKREVPIWKSDRWARARAGRPPRTRPRRRNRRSPG